MAKVTVDQIANYIIWRMQDAGDPVTHLKLQKLVYYVQAWYLALYGEVLVDDDFQAWVHGPVNRRLYARFAGMGSNPILLDLESEPELSEKVKKHVDDVLEAYADQGAWALERIVHEEEPWIEARAGLPMDAPCEKVIDRDSMRRFYSALLRSHDEHSKGSETG